MPHHLQFPYMPLTAWHSQQILPFITSVAYVLINFAGSCSDWHSSSTLELNNKAMCSYSSEYQMHACLESLGYTNNINCFSSPPSTELLGPSQLKTTMQQYSIVQSTTLCSLFIMQFLQQILPYCLSKSIVHYCALQYNLYRILGIVRYFEVSVSTIIHYLSPSLRGTARVPNFIASGRPPISYLQLAKTLNTKLYSLQPNSLCPSNYIHGCKYA